MTKAHVKRTMRMLEKSIQKRRLQHKEITDAHVDRLRQHSQAVLEGVYTVKANPHLRAIRDNALYVAAENGFDHFCKKYFGYFCGTVNAGLAKPAAVADSDVIGLDVKAAVPGSEAATAQELATLIKHTPLKKDSPRLTRKMEWIEARLQSRKHHNRWLKEDQLNEFRQRCRAVLENVFSGETIAHLRSIRDENLYCAVESDFDQFCFKFFRFPFGEVNKVLAKAAAVVGSDAATPSMTAATMDSSRTEERAPSDTPTKPASGDQDGRKPVTKPSATLATAPKSQEPQPGKSMNEPPPLAPVPGPMAPATRTVVPVVQAVTGVKSARAKKQPQEHPVEAGQKTTTATTVAPGPLPAPPDSQGNSSVTEGHARGADVCQAAKRQASTVENSAQPTDANLMAKSVQPKAEVRQEDETAKKTDHTAAGTAPKPDVQKSEGGVRAIRTMGDRDQPVLDGGIQVRVVLDLKVISEYAAGMKEGRRFPPIVVLLEHEGAPQAHVPSAEVAKDMPACQATPPEPATNNSEPAAPSSTTSDSKHTGPEPEVKSSPLSQEVPLGTVPPSSPPLPAMAPKPENSPEGAANVKTDATPGNGEAGTHPGAESAAPYNQARVATQAAQICKLWEMHVRRYLTAFPECRPYLVEYLRAAVSWTDTVPSETSVGTGGPPSPADAASMAPVQPAPKAVPH